MGEGGAGEMEEEMLGLLLTGDATSFEEAVHKLQALRATEAATEAATEVQVLTLLALLVQKYKF